ncbi:hypothetical protein OCU04_005332 [Sclerotinia nivalis]|uniref:Uncharacterized protein n=1 Tax=Sclerotinia nivalis TaxID=352851 RepID=A0A9X0AP59_9HELO|nr:hypothetical protein OCU04_005332 [Sclerotinia nivalis]
MHSVSIPRSQIFRTSGYLNLRSLNLYSTTTVKMVNEGQSDSFGKAHKSLNVMHKPLGQFAKRTGFYRNGQCDVGPEDTGNHSIAATLTDSFLDFSTSRGNNLRTIGLTGGKKWCLCASRWKEAMEAAKNSSEKDLVPKVHLHATHEKALDVVSLADLKKYAAEPEAADASTVPQSRKGNDYPGGVPTKERTELANAGEMTSSRYRGNY